MTMLPQRSINERVITQRGHQYGLTSSRVITGAKLTSG